MRYCKSIISCCIIIHILALSAFAEDRSIDGTGNNITNPEWGSTGEQITRLVDPAYSDGISTLAGETRESPRYISNTVLNQSQLVFDIYGRSDYLWAWGQFIDHDITLFSMATPLEPIPIDIPKWDPVFDPGGTGTQQFDMDRSEWDRSTGTDTSNPRQQINEITSWIDGSNVYGSDTDRAEWLRTGTDGKLKTSYHETGDMMPYNDGTQNNFNSTSTDLFVGGDVRSNEHVILTTMHTVFLREHNRLAEIIASENPTWTDEQIYQRARKIVSAEIQSITYNEFLPALLGDNAISTYTGYDNTINPDISNIFAAASYRVGHTMVSSSVLRLDENYQLIPAGPLDVKDAFLNPSIITDNGGIEPILRGLAYQRCQMIDNMIVDDLRNSLFSSFDLASFNIQRGRDHGLPDYNTIREYFNLTPVSTFADITSDIDLQQLLMQAYGSVDEIDPWVGMICEDHLAGARIGELNYYIIRQQFEYLRNCDRFWYQIDPELQTELAWLDSLSLSQVIQYNTNIKGLPANAFYAVPEPTSTVLVLTALVLMSVKKRFA